jgi:hypothetical protein
LAILAEFGAILGITWIWQTLSTLATTLTRLEIMIVCTHDCIGIKPKVDGINGAAPCCDKTNVLARLLLFIAPFWTQVTQANLVFLTCHQQKCPHECRLSRDTTFAADVAIATHPTTCAFTVFCATVRVVRIKHDKSFAKIGLQCPTIGVTTVRDSQIPRLVFL